MKEIDLRGTIAYAHAHPATIKLVEEGIEHLINHNETAVKILVSPSGEGL